MSHERIIPPGAAVYRYSQPGLTPDGERRLFYRTVTIPPDPDRLNVLLSAGDVITPPEVVSLCRTLAFELSAHEADEIAYILNLIRVTRPREEVLKAFPDLWRVEKLAAMLPIIQEHASICADMQQTALSQARSDTPVDELRRRANLLANLRAFCVIAARLSADPFFGPPLRKTRQAPFNRDVLFLWFLLDGLARKHGKSPSFRKDDGQGAETIARVLERAKVNITPAAVAKAIRRHKQKPLPVIYLPPAKLVPAAG